MQCLRLQRIQSTNDVSEVDSIYESTITSGTTSFLGQTSDSFVFNGGAKTPAQVDLFESSEDAKKLSDEKAEIFHHIVATALLLVPFI